MNNLFIILARGGSKGIPKKNTKVLCDKPLIAWSIEQGLNSKFCNKLVVSTDDQEIATIAQSYGAEVPVLRPAELATDTATSIDAVTHMVKFLEQQGELFDTICLLEPTSPLRDTEDIDNAYNLLLKNQKARSIVGVSKVTSAHPAFLNRIQEDGFISSFTDFSIHRRQDIEELYFFEGSVYISYTDTFLKEKSFYHLQALAYKVPFWKSFEIDDPEDFVVVEAILKAKLEGKFNLISSIK
jgi:CMP-N,N'-diacetyllegionaminic acid synthase